MPRFDTTFADVQCKHSELQKRALRGQHQAPLGELVSRLHMHVLSRTLFCRALPQRSLTTDCM